MEQQEIDYDDVMSLGFKEEFGKDVVYERQTGYKYKIVSLDITKKLYIDWDPKTRKCEMVRLDNKYNQRVQNRMPVTDIDELTRFVRFYKEVSEHSKMLKSLVDCFKERNELLLKETEQ